MTSHSAATATNHPEAKHGLRRELSVRDLTLFGIVWLFEEKLALGTAAMIGSGLLLYARGRARLRVTGTKAGQPVLADVPAN